LHSRAASDLCTCAPGYTKATRSISAFGPNVLSVIGREGDTMIIPVIEGSVVP
jgi:hypothetical protein